MSAAGGHRPPDDVAAHVSAGHRSISAAESTGDAAEGVRVHLPSPELIGPTQETHGLAPPKASATVRLLFGTADDVLACGLPATQGNRVKPLGTENDHPVHYVGSGHYVFSPPL